MPILVPSIAGLVTTNLVSTAMLGTGVPKYARGVALGLSYWLPKVRIATLDVGTAGAGKGVPLPLIIPSPLLYANIVAGMVSNGLTGVAMPAFALGLANGLSQVFLQVLTSTVHPTVGVGGGVAKFQGPPAYRDVLKGLQEAGLSGESLTKKSRALGMALDATFVSLIVPIAIVGPPSIVPGGGSGSGSLI